MNLSEIIIQKIKQNGPICFQEFMEMCLYYPKLGYYTSANTKIGKRGDFYTGAYLSSIFGELIGKQLEEMWEILGGSAFTIVEYGAGTGMLCHDILSYLKNNKKMYDQLNYYIIEKSPVMIEIEKSHLAEKVSWYNSIEDIVGINGCILSNELLDNFSVHKVVMDNELWEVFVDYKNDFQEVLKPASNELKQYLNELKIELPNGFQTEINLQTTHWIKEIGKALGRGYIMTIDYGYLSTELYDTSRNEGTLLCYHNHTVNDYLYSHIGSQDITSHVNFSALIHWGEKIGLRKCGFTDQCHFLLAMGYNKLIRQTLSKEEDIIQAARKVSFLNHTLLIDMGLKFKFLIQEKGMNGEKLLGLSLAKTVLLSLFPFLLLI